MAHTAHTVHLHDVMLCRALSAVRENIFKVLCPRRKKFSKTLNKMLKFANFP